MSIKLLWLCTTALLVVVAAAFTVLENIKFPPAEKSCFAPRRVYNIYNLLPSHANVIHLVDAYISNAVRSRNNSSLFYNVLYTRSRSVLDTGDLRFFTRNFQFSVRYSIDKISLCLITSFYS